MKTIQNLWRMRGAMAVFFFSGMAGLAWADSDDVALYPTDHWVWRVGTSFGPQSYDGDLRVEGTQGSVNADLDDVFKHATYNVNIQAEARLEYLGLLFSASVLDLNADIVDPTNSANISATLYSFDTLGSYGFGPWYVGEGSAGVELLGGARFNTFNGDIDTATSGGASAGRGWVDPVVGTRLSANFPFPMRVEAKGDWGGFGVGSATELTWRFSTTVHYQLDPVIEVFGGYRLTDIESQHQSGTRGTAIDGRISGPIFGILFILG